MRTSSSTWKASLNQWWNRQDNGHARRAILGVGNVQRSDDAAGCLVARRLLDSRAGPLPEEVLVIEAGPAPESFTGELRRFAPQFVLLLDAADMQEAVGAIQWIETDEISGMSASTHSLPLSMLAEYLRLELGCQVAVLGIQPASSEVGEEVSGAVRQGVGEASEGLRQWIFSN